MNAVGHRGARSAIGSFIWKWPSTTAAAGVRPERGSSASTTRSSPGTGCPAPRRYEVEVNSSQDFAAGSKVCCADKTIGTSLSPKKMFPNNTYYWRVRALDAERHSRGSGTSGPAFQKTFDPVEPYVPNLHAARQPAAARTGSRHGARRSSAWDPVPGRGELRRRGRAIRPRRARATGARPRSRDPGESPPRRPRGRRSRRRRLARLFPTTRRREESTTSLTAGTFCVRVRGAHRHEHEQHARGERVELHRWPEQRAAFTYNAPPGPVSTTGSRLAAGDYLPPARGAPDRRTPLFTWKHVTGACGYFIVVAKDAEFTTVIDVARTKIPAYAPRIPTPTPTRRTSYYWAVVPVVGLAVHLVFSAIGENNPHNFRKESRPPRSARSGARRGGRRTSPTSAGAPPRARAITGSQVAHDPTFSKPDRRRRTASTAYTSSSTYPADALLYWRVRANDENSDRAQLVRHADLPPPAAGPRWWAPTPTPTSGSRSSPGTRCPGRSRTT